MFSVMFLLANITSKEISEVFKYDKFRYFGTYILLILLDFIIIYTIINLIK